MKVTKTKDDITPTLKRLSSDLQKLPREAYAFWVKETPIRSGNARKNTTLKGDTIHANYAYAQRLDEGYSRQAPKGMVQPTVEFLQRRIAQLLRKK